MTEDLQTDRPDSAGVEAASRNEAPSENAHDAAPRASKTRATKASPKTTKPRARAVKAAPAEPVAAAEARNDAPPVRSDAHSDAHEAPVQTSLIGLDAPAFEPSAANTRVETPPEPARVEAQTLNRSDAESRDNAGDIRMADTNQNVNAGADSASASNSDNANSDNTNTDAQNPEVREPRGERLPEMRIDGRPEQRPDGRGLRFRGRDGRAELRRPEPRPFRGRPDNRQDNRQDNNRNDNRQDNRDGRNDNNQNNQNGRLMPRDGGQNGHNNRNDNRYNDNPRHETPRPRNNDVDLTTLEDKSLGELRDIARDLGIMQATSMKKTDIVFRIIETQTDSSGSLFKTGFLEILPDGKGFLRCDGYLPGDEDVYVSQSQIKRFNLKTGDMVTGQVRAPKEMERYYGLLRVEAINEQSPEEMKTRKDFEKLTPIFPDEKFKLETEQSNITARIIDLVTPIGKGQRGLIVAPAKAGKTSLIKNIANSLAANHPEVVLIVLLIDERPEEVTDISRSVKGEVVASTFDELPENHMRVSDMVLEKAKRLVEQKKDVVILMDSITRLSRASNLVVTPSGRTLAGGLDPAAMYRPKRMFGAARNIEEGGSLTILATALVDTGSRMDDMIFEEFKGTGNLDLILDRSLFDQRIFPAIDINKSGTRRDDLLLSKEDLATTYHLRRTLAALDNDKAITLLIDRLKNTKTNDDFMQVVLKSARQSGT